MKYNISDSTRHKISVYCIIQYLYLSIYIHYLYNIYTRIYIRVCVFVCVCNKAEGCNEGPGSTSSTRKLLGVTEIS